MWVLGIGNEKRKGKSLDFQFGKFWGFGMWSSAERGALFYTEGKGKGKDLSSGDLYSRSSPSLAQLRPASPTSHSLANLAQPRTAMNWP